MKNPKVSIVIPCFNYGHLIDETLDSIEKQTYKNYEVIIVNDASTDEFTNKHLSNLSSKYNVITHKKNRGLSESRNTGIKHSTGELILPIDSDDKISTNFIAKLVSHFQTRENTGLVYGKTVYFGDRKGVRLLPEYQLGEMLIRNLIPSCAMFLKSDWEKVGGFKKIMKYGYEDYDFWLSIIELGREVVFDPDVTFYYRKHKQAITKHSIASLQDKKLNYSLNKILEIHKKLYLDNVLELFKAAHFMAIENENLKQIIKEREEHIDYFKKYAKEKEDQVQIYKEVVESYEKGNRKNRSVFTKLKKLKGLISKFNKT
jgi:glycosyltransferase involved in cell wall biosynthesis